MLILQRSDCKSIQARGTFPQSVFTQGYRFLDESELIIIQPSRPKLLPKTGFCLVNLYPHFFVFIHLINEKSWSNRILLYRAKVSR